MLSNNDRKIIRFVLGITTGFTIAQLIDWQLSYIMPILLSMLLSGSQINLKAGLLFFLVITGGCLFGFLLSLTVVNYPMRSRSWATLVRSSRSHRFSR